MKVFLFYFFFLSAQCSLAQKPFIFPKIKAEGANIAQLTPSNWIVIDKAFGDLNQDQEEDLALILEYNQAVDETRTYGDNHSAIIKETQKPRILAMFFKDTSTGTYKLSMQNNDFILRSEEGGKLGDPLEKMHIKDQNLYLRFHGGAMWCWELGYTFKFENNDWYLTHAINLYYNQNSGEMTERIYDFKTRELFTTYGNKYTRSSVNQQTSEVLFFSNLRTFKTFKKPWAWEIAPGVYL